MLKSGLGVSSACLLALPAFLASAVEAKNAMNEIFVLERVDETYDDALKRLFELGKILRLKLSNQQLTIAIGLRLGSKICERHKCVCGKDVIEDGWHCLSCLKSAGRFFRHSNLNAFICAIPPDDTA